MPTKKPERTDWKKEHQRVDPDIVHALPYSDLEKERMSGLYPFNNSPVKPLYRVILEGEPNPGVNLDWAEGEKDPRGRILGLMEAARKDTAKNRRKGPLNQKNPPKPRNYKERLKGLFGGGE